MVSPGQSQWAQWSTDMHLLVTRPTALAEARIVVDAELDAIELAASRFRPDSEICALAQADGVHLGQDDLPPADVRKLAGPDLIIGWSTHSPEQARQAADLPVDYIGVGPVAATATKGYREGKGPELVRAVCACVELPTVAIGGITAHNAASVIEAGATGVAVCAALCSADDPAAAARELRAVVERAARGRGGAHE